MSEDINKAKSIIAAGSEIIGDSAGAAIGFLIGGAIGGFGGAIAGASLGKITSKSVEKVITDFATRSLSKREEIRVGATAALAIIKIDEYLKSGYSPRNDDFFVNQNSERTPAEEIFEGVLQKTKNEHEEKKTKVYANIFANVSFAQGITLGEANHILQITEQLTYRQICFLAMLYLKSQNQEFILRNHNYENMDGISYERISLLSEIFYLNTISLIYQKIHGSEEGIALLSWGYIIPNDLCLTYLGQRYSKAMGLQDISAEDIKKIATFLI
ncbi:hypothetical protein IQ244_26285 [Nostoc sp. LEGE 06077]|uniref:hypothetical protein n=1 Tax=Nostoc sp. LEGE 06077 TaxID=915325 RepID=UPI00187E1521|nr:hypothetical protein [Nostoc sp. LEGE 06077]MBE9209939.1 hypothetical protein [Nostoc sp. LEGE 06077]